MLALISCPAYDRRLVMISGHISLNEQKLCPANAVNKDIKTWLTSKPKGHLSRVCSQWKIKTIFRITI